MVKYLREWRNGRKRMTRKLRPEKNKQQTSQILGFGERCDGSKNPEITLPAARRASPVKVNTSEFK
jgi:hypothetical protein